MGLLGLYIPLPSKGQMQFLETQCLPRSSEALKVYPGNEGASRMVCLLGIAK